MNFAIQKTPTDRRRGAAAVECAIVLPVLTLLVLGAIDVGQFANVYQRVSDASREGARVAVRHTTKHSSEVQTAVTNYLKSTSAGATGAALASATQVTVTDTAGNPIPGGNLSNVSTGSAIQVRVALTYDPVRWIDAISGLDGTQITATTIMRRE